MIRADGLHDGGFDAAVGFGEAEVIQHESQGEDGRQRVGDVLAGVFGRGAVHGFEHGGALRVDVARRRQAQAALQLRPQIRDDVAEHVAGHDDLELFRAFHHLHGQGIHVQVLLFDIRVLGADLLERAQPEVVPEAQRIALIRHGDFRAPFGLGKLEGVADDALHTLARVHVLLNRHLVGRALLEITAHAHVQAFGVFAEHHEIHVRFGFVLEWTELAVGEFHRSVVDVQIELEAQAQQDVAGVRHVRHARIAQRADVHGVVILAKIRHLLLGHGGAVPQVPLGAVIKVFDVQREILYLFEAFQDFHGFARHVDADAVAGNDRDFLGSRHVCRSPEWLFRGANLRNVRSKCKPFESATGAGD